MYVVYILTFEVEVVAVIALPSFLTKLFEYVIFPFQWLLLLVLLWKLLLIVFVVLVVHHERIVEYVVDVVCVVKYIEHVLSEEIVVVVKDIHIVVIVSVHINVIIITVIIKVKIEVVVIVV